LRVVVPTIILLILAVFSLFVGVADITVADIINWDVEKISLISISRIPRTAALILAGVGMSVSGVIMQHFLYSRHSALIAKMEPEILPP
jgi:iron complex transport system permease protein